MLRPTPDPRRVRSAHAGMRFGSLLSFFPFAHLENSSHLQLHEKGREAARGRSGRHCCLPAGNVTPQSRELLEQRISNCFFPQSLIIGILSSQVFHYQSCCHSPTCKLSGCYCEGKCHNSKYTCRITFVYARINIPILSLTHTSAALQSSCSHPRWPKAALKQFRLEQRCQTPQIPHPIFGSCMAERCQSRCS